jgi:hypothetical protein
LIANNDVIAAQAIDEIPIATAAELTVILFERQIPWTVLLSCDDALTSVRMGYDSSGMAFSLAGSPLAMVEAQLGSL